MVYAVKEVFLTLQGEGIQSGRRAVFCRFSGCNLWSGREEDRSAALCYFCDTDFVGVDGVGGGKFADAGELGEAIAICWGEGLVGRLVVLTGGEPMLQVDSSLIGVLHERGFTIAIETNGTLPVPGSIDWICVSPKLRSILVQTMGDELKLVYPQPGISISESDLEHFLLLDFAHFLVQPLDDDRRSANLRVALDLVSRSPRWQLSLQTHKILGLP